MTSSTIIVRLIKTEVFIKNIERFSYDFFLIKFGSALYNCLNGSMCLKLFQRESVDYRVRPEETQIWRITNAKMVECQTFPSNVPVDQDLLK